MKKYLITIFALLFLCVPTHAQQIGPPSTGPAGATGATGPAGPAPTGNAPQIVGYSAANTVEAETVSGAGDCGTVTFSRTGANAYTMTTTCLNSNGNAFTSAAFGSALNLTAPPAFGGTTSNTVQATKIAVGTSAPTLPATVGWGAYSVVSGNCLVLGSHIATIAGTYFTANCNDTPSSTTTGFWGSTTSSVAQAFTSFAVNINGNQRVLVNNTSFSVVNGVAIQSTGGTAPTISAGCNGAGSSVTAGSTNNRGQITTQTSATTTCTISFSAAGAWAQTPFCVVGDSQAQITPAAYSVGATSTSSFVVDFVSAANDKFNYVCM